MGDVKFIDQDGNGVLDSDDYIKLGSAIPDFIYGLNGNVSYKNLDFSIAIVGSQGNEIANTMTAFLGRGENFGNLLNTRLNRYHPENNPIR
ncbi:TonB-dependent receptor P26 [subsurface metagenome]